MILIPNFNYYTWDLDGNTLILTHKILSKTEEELSNYKVEKCVIDNDNIRLKKLSDILSYLREDEDVYEHSTKKILKEIFNINNHTLYLRLTLKDGKIYEIILN